GAAAFVGDGKPPAAHAVIPALGNGPAHAPRPHNDNAAIFTGVCTHAGSVSVAGKGHPRKGEWYRLSLRQSDGLTSPSQRQARDDPALAMAETCLFEALVGGGAYRGQAVLHAKPKVRGSGGALTDHPPVSACEPGATPRTSPIDAQQQ